MDTIKFLLAFIGLALVVAGVLLPIPEQNKIYMIIPGCLLALTFTGLLILKKTKE